nr:MAG TPA: hypothetical protein [Caudoviricetes sp.]
MIWIFVFIAFLTLIVFGIFYDSRDNYFDHRAKEGLVNKDGCKGLVGGTKATGYLQWECINCPYYKGNVIRKDDE